MINFFFSEIKNIFLINNSCIKTDSSLSFHIKNKKKSKLLFTFFITVLSFIFFLSSKNKENNCIPTITASHRQLKQSKQIYEVITFDYITFEKALFTFNEKTIKELLNHDTQIIKSNKNTNKIKKSVKVINEILELLKKIQQHYLEFHEENENFIKTFLDLIEQGAEKAISIHKLIYNTFMTITGNHAFLNSDQIYNANFNLELIRNPNNDTLHCLLWVFYIYDQIEKISELDIKINIEDYLAIYAYPIIKKKKHTTFTKIRFEETLSYFRSFLKTTYAQEVLSKIQYIHFANEKNAYIEISKNNIFTLLLMNEENSNEKEIIKKKFEEIAAIEKQMTIIERGHQTTSEIRKENQNRNFLYKIFDIKRVPLAQYLSDFIPDWPFVKTNKYSHPFFYTVGSGFKFYINGWMNGASNIVQMINKYSSSSSNDKSFSKVTLIDNPLTRSIPGLPCFIPYYSNPEKATQINNWGKRLSDLSEDEIEQKTGAINRYNGFTLWDTLLITRNTQLPFSQKTFGSIMPTLTTFTGIIFHIGKEATRVWQEYHHLKNIIYQFESVKNFYTYFNLLNELIIKSKELLVAIEVLYQKNNIPNEWLPSPCSSIQDIFSKKNKKFQLVKTIINKNKTVFKKTKNYIVNFFAPGTMAHFYFNDLEENKEIEILKHFIACIDLTFAKIELVNLSKKENYSNYSFSIPTILDPENNKDIIFEAENIWYTVNIQKPIKNSISLNKENRNMLIVSPVAGGKSVFLSTILTSLYLANLGIVPGEKLTYTYFNHIVDHLTHPYDMGSGLSQHLAERKSMQELKYLTQIDETKKLVIIDEIYKGTIPTLAVQEAYLDLPPILLKTNIVTIITTHFPEITRIVNNIDYALKLYYIKVNHFAGVFEKTYKLYLDDIDNWWIRDFSLALKYQLSQKK